MTLDGTGEAFTDGGSDDVDFLAFGKVVDFELLASLKLAFRRPLIGIEAKFGNKVAGFNLRFREVACFRLALPELIEAWLERTPFVNVAGYDFRDVYRQAVTDMLEREAEVVRGNPALGEAEKNAEIESLKAARTRFDSIFDEGQHQQLREAGVWRLSWQALQAALFINLYRDEPALQLPFRLLSGLMDIDVTMTSWRYRHALMVQRMIGRKVGTGGSSGHEYLRQTAERHRVFGDLFALSTFFIQRSRLPELPKEIREAMGYRYSGVQP